jgi:transposase InsO family protein
MIATCLTIRAIHLEIVHSLSTDSCIMAIRNFVSRRGLPRELYSDRGTNFIGANRKLNDTAKDLDLQAIMKEFVSTETTWLFNPPASPHMGGSWERLVRSVKTNLLAICPAHKFSDETLRNVLAEVELTVNSRPLTYVPVDDESAEALTPNHFLLGSCNGVKPLTTFNDFDGAALRQHDGHDGSLITSLR